MIPSQCAKPKDLSDLFIFSLKCRSSESVSPAVLPQTYIILEGLRFPGNVISSPGKWSFFKGRYTQVLTQRWLCQTLAQEGGNICISIWLIFIVDGWNQYNIVRIKNKQTKNFGINNCLSHAFSCNVRSQRLWLKRKWRINN